jgi:hypothetical protein
MEAYDGVDKSYTHSYHRHQIKVSGQLYTQAALLPTKQIHGIRDGKTPANLNTSERK